MNGDERELIQDLMYRTGDVMRERGCSDDEATSIVIEAALEDPRFRPLLLDMVTRQFNLHDFSEGD